MFKSLRSLSGVFRRASALLCLAVALSLCGCHFAHCAEKKLNIVASTFPVYIFTANVCAGIENINVELLIPAAAGCPHDYALKPADIRKLDKADILVVNGAGLEEFLARPLAELERKPEIIDAGANVPVLDSVEAGHDHINPHIFAAPGEAALMVGNIGGQLSSLDKAHAEQYVKNARAYTVKLVRLSEDFRAIGQAAKNPAIAIEHDALAYLAQNAGLKLVACLESNASANQLAQIKKSLEQSKPALLAGDAQYPDKSLTALAQETGIPIARLDICASGPENAPLDYYEKMMAKNLEILRKYFD